MTQVNTQLELNNVDIIPPLIPALAANIKVVMCVKCRRKTIRALERGAESFERESLLARTEVEEVVAVLCVSVMMES